MRRFIAIAALLLSGCGAEAAGVEGALSAYRQNRVAEAEATFARLIADPGAKPADKALAHFSAGRIAWHIDRNLDKALNSLALADATGEERCETAIMQARILRDADRAEPVLALEGDHLQRCSEPQEIDRLRLAQLGAALDLAASDPARRGDSLARAQALLDKLGDDARMGLQGASLALQLALLRGDGAGALKAWKDYFWLSDTDVPQALARRFPSGAALFQAGLAANADLEARLALLDLLVTAGFAREAERFAAANGFTSAAAGKPTWRKAEAYFRWRRQLEETVLASNRRTARGGRSANLRSEYEASAKRLLAAIGLKGDPKQVLRDVYGLYGTAGETGGYKSIHLGHIAQSERRQIEQYGHRAEVGFLVLDNMISNGFETWLWDGYAAAGGWTEEGPLIVQVRPEYTSSPIGSWRLYGDTQDRRELLAKQQERAAVDLAAVKRDGVAYLPGLADRLRLQVIDQVGARARAKVGGAGDLRGAFLDEYWRAEFNQSIFAHEGRHALDRKLVTGLTRLNDTNLEYRAKLSELALAEYPRLALYNINAATIGGDSAHGKANARILSAYGTWMGEHSAEIRGYDPSYPALVQLDRLTDEQLRTVAKALDPIVTK
jgi:hypothetical protein